MGASRFTMKAPAASSWTPYKVYRDGEVREASFDFLEELSQHLVPERDNVCVLTQVYIEKPIIRGDAWAVRSPALGETYMVQTDLLEILYKAKRLFRLRKLPDDANWV
jgi:hypothetical protein